MPPKAKESKPAPPDPDAAAAEQKALMESELVTALLRTRLGRYQAAGEKLAVENFTLSDELAKQKLTLADINEFLTNELKARSLAAAQLEERVAQLSTRMAEAQKESQAETARIKAEAAAEVAAASARAVAAASTAGGDGAADGSPADAAGQKAQLERTIAELTAALTARQKDFDARLSDMERRHLQEKEKMRKEAATKIRETKVAMAQLADQHLESSTKRTLVENETMVAELAYHTAQSHDLVAANTMLRNETAELRRQLAIAHKTVQSTARKNLLLQQTIKSILTCLREEARQNAEAAIAAHQEHHAYACAAVCDSPTAGVQPHSPCMQAYAQAHMHLGEQQHWQQQQHGYQPQHECADSQQQQQQQQDAAGDADAVLQQLEARVLQLSDELSAAKQAMAATLQGCLPDGLQAPCTITVSGQHTAASTAVAAAAAAPEGKELSQHKQRRQNGQQQGQQQVSAPEGGVQQGPMEAALEDGVAAFVLYCVQQLRRGGALNSSSSTSSSPSRQQTAGLNARLDRASNSSGKGAGRQSVSRGRASRSVSPAVGTRAAAAAAAADGGSKGGSPPAAAAAAGPGGRALSPPQLAVPAEVATGDGCEGVWGSREVVSATNIAEQLARLLLEQLHMYSRHNMPPYDGLGFDFGDDPQQQQQQQQQQPGGVVVHSGHHAGPAAEQIAQWPVAALQVQGAGQLTATAAAAGVGGCLSICAGVQQGTGASRDFVGVLAGAEECSTSLQLPPLPCLLNNMGHSQQAASPITGAPAPAAAAAAGAGVGGRGGRSKSPGRSDREGLFSAVLSELRPWGPAVGVAGGSSGTTASGGAPAAGALASPIRAGAAVIGGHGVFSRSKTPTSPGVGVMRGHSPVSSPSSRVAASRPAAQH